MWKKIIPISGILMMILFSSSVAGSDNSVQNGARKVEGGFKEVGKSATQIGTKAGKAASGAAKDTGEALGRAWENIVQGLKKAFK